MPRAASELHFGSTNQLACTFSGPGRTEHYSGQISKFGRGYRLYSGRRPGLDRVRADREIGPGSLAGTYSGATAGGDGRGRGSVNALVGGSNNTISLQPVSFQGNTGLNIAAGIASMTLTPTP